MRAENRKIIERLLEAIDAPAEWIRPWQSGGSRYPDVIRETPRIDTMLDKYYHAERIKYVEVEQDGGFYAPEVDAIVLPLKKQFKSLEAYAGAKAHETIHSTGDYTRCNRPTFSEFTSFTFGDSKYSREELVAEIGACFLLHALEMDTAYVERNAGAYLANWVGHLNNNTRWIYKAGELAEEAVDYILEAIEREEASR